MTVFLLCLTSTGGLVLLLFKQTRSSDIFNNRKYQQKLNHKHQHRIFSPETWKTTSAKFCSSIRTKKMLILMPTFVLTGFMQAFQSALQRLKS